MGCGVSGLGPEAMPELLLFGLIVFVSLCWLLFSAFAVCSFVLGSVLDASNACYIMLGSHLEEIEIGAR